MKYLVAGLGNIGEDYSQTRHNIGFMVLDAWAQASNTVFTSGRYGSTAEVRFRGRTFVLLKPSTYMNLSGNAVRYYLQKCSIEQSNLLVILDDLALPFGTLRLRARGSSGGHNGLNSIDYTLGSDDYARLRLGIGNGFPRGGQINYVLGDFLLEEKRALPVILEKAVEAAKCFALEGVGQAMTRYNHSWLPSSPSSEKKEE